MTNTQDTLSPGTIGRRRAATLPEQPPQLWRSVKPKKAYDAVIVGGGGHGLATAYYLAKNHSLTKIAVLEKGWLAGGNTARNTTIILKLFMGRIGGHLRALTKIMGDAGARPRL